MIRGAIITIVSIVLMWGIYMDTSFKYEKLRESTKIELVEFYTAEDIYYLRHDGKWVITSESYDMKKEYKTLNEAMGEIEQLLIQDVRTTDSVLSEMEEKIELCKNIVASKIKPNIRINLNKLELSDLDSINLCK